MLTAPKPTRFGPYANDDVLLGAVHLPSDGQTNPVDTTQALANGARSRGAEF